MLNEYRLEGSLFYIKKFIEKRNENGRLFVEVFNCNFTLQLYNFSIKLAPLDLQNSEE
jgi:hypothetical protein